MVRHLSGHLTARENGPAPVRTNLPAVFISQAILLPAVDLRFYGFEEAPRVVVTGQDLQRPGLQLLRHSPVRLRDAPGDGAAGVAVPAAGAAGYLIKKKKKA